MAAPLHQQRSYTYRDYRGWDGRWELVHGEPYDLSPAPSRQHQRLLVDLAVQIGSWLEGKSCELFTAPFDVILAELGQDFESAETVLQPDLVVVCDESKLDDYGCLGAPDWVIEILSPSTAARDHLVKRDLYERHGVAEYWLVHPTELLLTRYRRTLEGRFTAPSISALSGRTAVGVLSGFEIDWDRISSRQTAF